MTSSNFPSPADFILKQPLYLPTRWNDEQVYEIADLKYFSGALDSFCTECKCWATFHGRAPGKPEPYNLDTLHRIMGTGKPKPTMEDGAFSIQLVCTRNNQHVQHFMFLLSQNHYVKDGKVVTERFIQKIGQYPSSGDLQIPHLLKYRTILGDVKHRELVRGVGLASHDVGIGAFVYVRRVFEALLEEAHIAAKDDPAWNEDQFQRQRVLEQIKSLEQHLPPTLVENRKIYSILSKGIHDLTEEECLQYFEPLRMGIELILDEKMEVQSRRSKTEKLRKFVSDTSTELKGST